MGWPVSKIDGVSNFQYKNATVWQPASSQGRGRGHWTQQGLQQWRLSIPTLAFWELEKCLLPSPFRIIGSGIVRCGKDFDGNDSNPLLTAVATMLIQCESGISLPFTLNFWGIITSLLDTRMTEVFEIPILPWSRGWDNSPASPVDPPCLEVESFFFF